MRSALRPFRWSPSSAACSSSPATIRTNSAPGLPGSAAKFSRRSTNRPLTDSRRSLPMYGQPLASANSVLDARRPRAPRPSLPSLQQCRPRRRRVGSARIRMPSRRHRPLHPSWSRRRSLLHPSWRRRRRDPRPSLRNQNLPQPSKPPGEVSQYPVAWVIGEPHVQISSSGSEGFSDQRDQCRRSGVRADPRGSQA